MLDKNSENASDMGQEKPVKKYFQFHLKKEQNVAVISK